METVIEDYYHLKGDGPYDLARVERVCRVHVDWESDAGDDKCWPSTLDEFAPLELHRRVIELRDACAVA